MLHIVKHYRFLSDVHTYSNKDDTILLVEDAVYAANPAHKAHKDVASLSIPVYYLAADADARGVIADSLVKVIDFYGFVELTVQQVSSMTWD